MRDIQQDAEGDRPYECFECGTIVFTTSNADTCPECGGRLRNREMPLE